MKIWTIVDYNLVDHFYVWAITTFIFVFLSAYYMVYPKLKALSNFSPFKKASQSNQEVVAKPVKATP